MRQREGTWTRLKELGASISIKRAGRAGLQDRSLTRSLRRNADCTPGLRSAAEARLFLLQDAGRFLRCHLLLRGGNRIPVVLEFVYFAK
ncbi:hypothetical protein [Paenibacillus elgii]|uniref:hypothetical protein n=1 Tax=Paenibacillus elgii TaxID=189691 RepID=UPI0030D7B73A